jgi:hypothetical protein
VYLTNINKKHASVEWSCDGGTPDDMRDPDRAPDPRDDMRDMRDPDPAPDPRDDTRDPDHAPDPRGVCTAPRSPRVANSRTSAGYCVSTSLLS